MRRWALLLFVLMLSLCHLTMASVASAEPVVENDRHVSTWSELQGALELNGAIIKLTNNIVGDAGAAKLQVPSGVSVELDLCGFTISRALTTEAADGCTLALYGDMVLKDTVTGTGTITGGIAVHYEHPLTIAGSLSPASPIGITVLKNSPASAIELTGGLFAKGGVTELSPDMFVSEDPDREVLLRSDGNLYLEKPLYITFDSNGGFGTMKKLKTYAKDSTALTANAFSRDDHVFAGWNTAADGSGTAYSDEAVMSIESDTTLYAQWSEVKYCNVSFDPNGGTGSMATVSVKEGTSYSLPACSFTAPLYHEFAGWIIGNNKYDVNDSITPAADTVVKADWSVMKCSVSFDANGGSGEMGTVTVDEGVSYILPENAFTPPENSVFAGWIIGEDTYSPGDSIVPVSDTTVKANWSLIEYKTVSFDTNGGSKMDPVNVIAGQSYVIPDCSSTRAGYLFYGWYIDNTYYPVGETITVTDNITLKAAWTFNKESLGDSDSKFDISEGYSDFTDDLKNAGFDTEEKVKNAMYTAVVEELEDEDIDEAELIVGSQLYDVGFLVSFDGGTTWEKVTVETFPDDGLTVEMAYPEGSDAKTNNFVVAHMFSHNMLGHKAGETETIIPEKTETGIKFKVSSLSPIVIAWWKVKEKPTATPTVLLRPLNHNTNFSTHTAECTLGFCGKIVFSLYRDASEACA